MCTWLYVVMQWSPGFRVDTMHAWTVASWLVPLIVSADDDNRIVLKPLADVSDCQRDYINACYVDVREL